MDSGLLFGKGFWVRSLCNESFIVEFGSNVPGDFGKTAIAFSNVDDLMGFLLDEKDAFINRKAPAP